MKVAVVGRYFPAAIDPWAGQSAYQTLRVLATLCDVHVFCPIATYPKGLKPPSRAADAREDGWTPPPDVAATYIPYPIVPIVSRPFNGRSIGRSLFPYVRAYQPDIIMNYVVYPDGFAAVSIGRKLNVPVVLTAIGSDLNRMGDPISTALTRYALRHADTVTTVSRDLAKTAQANGANPNTLRAILNGSDTTIFYPQDRALARQRLGLDPEAEIVLFVGRLDKAKGLIELIDAVAALRARRPKLLCYIVGNGPDGPALREAISRNNAADIITLAPPVYTNDVATWMAASNLVTLPSYREGCPNVIIEALAAGRPVVATNVGGIPELVDDTCGRLVPSHNVPALTEALDQTLSHSWNADDIATKHNKSWADVAAELHSVLTETLSRRNSAKAS